MPLRQSALLTLFSTLAMLAAGWALASVGDTDPLGLVRIVALVGGFAASVLLGTLGRSAEAGIALATSFVFFLFVPNLDSDWTLGWGGLWWFRVMFLLVIFVLVILISHAVAGRRRRARF